MFSRLSAHPRLFAHKTARDDRNVVKSDSDPNHEQDVYIGRSEVAMWMRIVSSWVCMLLYMWSLLAPVIMPDRRVYPSSSVYLLVSDRGHRFGDY